jgi:hypothetical protein
MNATFSTNPNQSISLQDIETALLKLRGLPPVKWILIAPDGRTWADADPLTLAQIAVSGGFKLGEFNPVPYA